MRKFVALMVLAMVVGCGGRPVPPAAPVPEPEPAPAAVPAAPAAPVAVPASPLAPPAADSTLGRLAYVRDGKLYIYDFGSGQERQVTESGSARAPAWDASGHWLAFLWRSGDTAPSEVRVAAAEGEVVSTFPAVADPFRIAWSPVAAALLAQTQKELWLLQPDGAAAQVAPGGDFAWAPDGKQIAYVTSEMKGNPPPTDTLWTAPVAGGAPVQRLTEARAGIWLAGWWPDGQGLVYWLAGAHSASIGADGVVLGLLPFAGGEPKQLSLMLANRDWISWAPDNRRFVAVVGGGREPWVGKSLAVCSTSKLTCDSLPQPEGVVSTDPAWSPAGDLLAFVRGADLGGMGRSADWAPTRSLWVSTPDGRGARALTAAGKGVLAPRWSRDGWHILFLRDGAICLIDADGSNMKQLPGGPVVAPVAWYQP